MKSFCERYQAFLDRLEKIAVWVTSFLLALLLGNETLGILFDIFGSQSIPWTTELSVCLFAWLVLLGSTILFRHGAHISLDFLVDYFPEKLRFFLRIGYAGLAIIVVIVFIYFGAQLAFFVGRFQKSVYLGLSLFYFYLSVPVGGLLMGLNALGMILPNPRREELSKLAKIEENPLY